MGRAWPVVPAVVADDGGTIHEYHATTVGIRRAFLHTAHSSVEGCVELTDGEMELLRH